MVDRIRISRNWTIAELDRLRMLAREGKGVEAIATELGRSVSAVYAQSLRFGFSLRQVKRKKLK
jgi:hypothetical protein